LAKLKRFARDVSRFRVHNHAREFWVRRALARGLVRQDARAFDPRIVVVRKGFTTEGVGENEAAN
jgi:hypothetical protein